MFENEMTFVKIDSEESEFAAIRRYATLKNYIRDRERRERLDNLEEAPTPRERRRLNDDLEEVSTPPPPPPPTFEKGKKSRKNNNVSHNKNSTSGGSISSSTSNNSTAVTPTASIRQLSKRKNAKNSKTTSASQRNASSSSDVTPRRMKEVEKKQVSKNISNTSSSSSEIGKKRKKASKKKILIKKTTSNAKKPRRNIDWGDERLTYNQNAVENTKKKHHLYTSFKPKFLRKNISEVGGGGVIEFLPSDVRSLRKQLTYLIGEYRAGNRSLKNKIAAILKNLHNRKVMTKREYDTQINSIFVGEKI